MDAPFRREARPVLDGREALERLGRQTSEIQFPIPGRGEQYRFHIDLTRCIGCRCCEVACNEQNNNPAEVKWRKVGEIEGGSYPQVRRLYLSMSCNHCLEPSCLEGCPVDAYTKRPDGIVVHDAEACIGCQYCVWNCPYGAPQYHPERHVVTKCHLCVDRLEQRQLPACVEACPSSAIEVETVKVFEWRRAIALADAPGVPAADVTFSTTRITLPEDLPESMGKTEAQNLRPEAPHGSLVLFLVLSQWSVGLFAAALLLQMEMASGVEARASAACLLPLAGFGLAQLALASAIFHLGRPLHAARALIAWKRSWLSREVLAFSLYTLLAGFCAAPGLFHLAAWKSPSWLPGLDTSGPPSAPMVLTLLAGLLGIFCSAGIYRLPARPAWNSRRTTVQFFCTAAVLGAASGLFCLLHAAPGVLPDGGAVVPGLAVWAMAGLLSVAAIVQASVPWSLVLEGITADDPSVKGAAVLMTRHFRRLLWLRTLLFGAAAALGPLAAFRSATSSSVSISAAALVVCVAAELAGRYLFFVTVVPRHTPSSFAAPRR